MNGSIDLIVFTDVIENTQGAKALIPQNDRSPSRSIAERNRQDTVLVRRIFSTIQPHGGFGANLVVSVQYLELMASGPQFLDKPQIAFMNQGAAAFSIADEFHNEDSSLVQFGESKLPLRPFHGSILVIQHALPSGGQSVQVDGGVDWLQVAAVEIEGVDLEYLDQQGLDVLDRQLQLDRLVCLEKAFIVGRKVKIDPIFKGFHCPGRKHGIPFFGIPYPGE